MTSRNFVFIYYILNWFGKILHILDKLSNICVEFINNENIITDLRIWIFSHFLNKKAKNLKKKQHG